MLIAERFLRKNSVIIDFPIPYEEGVCGYELKEKNIRTINFVSYKTISYKNNFYKYNFKFNSIISNYKNKENTASSNVAEIDYNNFYSTFLEIKNKILGAETYSIIESPGELQFYRWKSFVICNDAWFANHMAGLPDSFLKSIDQALPISKRLKFLDELLDFLNDKHYNMVYSWEVYNPRGEEKKFLDWFPKMMGWECTTAA